MLNTIKKRTKRISKPSYAYLIEKKRDAGEFTDEEIRYIVDSIYDNEMPDFQMAALAMAIYFQGMSAQETAVFADEMMLSGEMLDLSSLSTPKIAKYTTGGVGDKTSLILVPLAAAAGITMPHLTSPEEDMVVTLQDKLNSLTGFEGKKSFKELQGLLKKNNCAMIEHDEKISLVDTILFKLRQNTATIQSLPLITGSVLSKKLSLGIEGLVVDVKWGNGAYIKDLEQAKQLARTITRVSKNMKRRAVALVTDMNQPIGDTVGSGLEIKEAIEFLQGKGSEDLQELVLKIGMEIVRLAGIAGSTLAAKQTVQKMLKDGLAYQKFIDMLRSQGVTDKWIEDTSLFPVAKYTKKLPAPKRGYVHNINAGMIARGVQLLSKKADGKMDVSAGITEIKKVGVQVKQGEPLIMIHYNDEANLDSAMEYFRSAYRLAPRRPNPPQLIVERIA